jgi:dTDP-glucose 4,6-dehydratase
MLSEDDPKIRQPDITLAQSLFGLKPKVQRSEGLKRTLKYFEGANRNKELINWE